MPEYNCKTNFGSRNTTKQLHLWNPKYVPDMMLLLVLFLANTSQYLYYIYLMWKTENQRS